MDRAMPGRSGTLGPSIPEHLRWSLEAEQASDPSVNGKEEYHAGSNLCPGLDLQAGQAPDD